MNGSVVYKMSGSGNDFVFVDGRMSSLDQWGPESIERVCSRRLGVGADGFAVLEPGAGAGRVRFHFFNRDGTRAPMCGNGALCATRMARWLELVPGPDLVLETDAGEVRCRALDGPKPLAEFMLPEIPTPLEPEIDAETGERSIHFLSVGVPHLVLLVDDVSQARLTDRGRELRHHPAVGSAGANVNFLGTDPAGSSNWRMRTYERGVEAETLACGTGAVACAAALVHSRTVQSLPWDVHTSSGQVLTVGGTVDASSELTAPTLTGEARLVFRAILS